MSEIESALRAQRDMWKEVSERVVAISSREFPPEPPKRILVFGIGSSHFAAKLTGYSLMRDRDRLRIPVVSSSSLAVGGEIAPQKGDWAFGLSHRGKTPATLKALEISQKAGAFTLLVGGQGLDHVMDLPYVKYYLPTCPQEKCEPHTIAVSSAICAVTTLMLGLRAVEEWDALRSIGDPNLDLLRERSGKGPSILLGEWEGEWLAKEGALKLMEMARLPVRAFSTEEFFHGPRYSLTPDDKLWHVSLAKDWRNKDVKSDYRIDVRGGSPMSWMPALVELQWLALAVSLNLGLDPDVPPS